MSLARELIVYHHFDLTRIDATYGESYQLYRILQEHIDNSYVNGKTRIERELSAARRLLLGECTFDKVYKEMLQDCGDSISLLSCWYNEGVTSEYNLSSDVCQVLRRIDVLVPPEVRKTGWIFTLDDYADEIPKDICKPLESILHRYEHSMKLMCLDHIADVFNPLSATTGRWYDSFCVETYLHSIQRNTVCEHLKKKLLHAFYSSSTISQAYTRFRDIGKNHFNTHTVLSMRKLFDLLNCKEPENSVADFIINVYARHCIDTYQNLKDVIDVIIANNSCSYKKKNAVFDLLCVSDPFYKEILH
ncbi:ORF18 [Plodia interpunctella granulovirus]|uniref:ORF18 n=1 Tax=Plodia interpunctella granulovirus TaxID=262175 RepID=A0A1L5JGI6_9BBAC|nr:ORF18 [Plodia interpunctella granulovirus]APO13902.1 ORF18 [Plodia interpunctella granulovirus]